MSSAPGGIPAVVTGKLIATPALAVTLAGLVKLGGPFTVSVKDCMATKT